VRLSQSASAPKDLTSVQRNPDTALRVLTHMASYTMALNNLVMPRRMTQKEVTGATARLVVLVMTSAMLKALFDEIFPKLEEKDRKREPKWMAELDDSAGPAMGYALRAGLDVVGNVPIAGRIAQSALTGREPRFAGGALEALITGGGAAMELVAGDEITKKQAKAAADAIGLITGLPTRNVLFAPGEFYWEFLNGNIEEEPGAFLQEAFLARAGQKGDK
jgi:hypothetical protein